MPITLTRQLALSAGTPPYNYVWETNANCVTIEQPSGTSTDGIIPISLTASDETCLATATFTASGTDANGCEFSETVSFPTPCDLVLNSISQVGELHLTVAATDPNCTSVQFQWTYPNQFLRVLGQTDGPKTSALRLAVIEGVYPSGFYPVSVTATDCYGCTKTQTINLSVCTPQLKALSVPVICSRSRLGVTLSSARITIPLPDTCPSSVDWRTVQFSLPAGFTVTQTVGILNQGGVITQNAFVTIQITANETVAAGSYTGTYSALTKDGRALIPGNVTLSVGGCDGEVPFELVSSSYNVDCSTAPGATVLIPIENKVLGAADWSTAQILQTSAGSATIENRVVSGQPQYVIVYVTPNPIVNATISWRVADANGLYPAAATVAIVPCQPAPTLVVDNVTASCGIQKEIDVLANDNPGGSAFVDLSLRIINAPSSGFVTVSNGKIYYTAEDGFEGNDTFTYTVSNAFGQEAAPQSVNITVTCIAIP